MLIGRKWLPVRELATWASETQHVNACWQPALETAHPWLAQWRSDEHRHVASGTQLASFSRPLKATSFIENLVPPHYVTGLQRSCCRSVLTCGLRVFGVAGWCETMTLGEELPSGGAQLPPLSLSTWSQERTTTVGALRTTGITGYRT